MTEANKPAQPLGFGSTDQLGRAPFEERRMTIDKKRIADEAQHFFEWPDPKHRDTVTLTSCVIFAATIAEMVNAENIGRGEKLADELRGEIARLHGAVCQAVALLNRAPELARCEEGRQAHTILREVLVLHADNAGPNAELTGREAVRLDAGLCGEKTGECPYCGAPNKRKCFCKRRRRCKSN